MKTIWKYVLDTPYVKLDVPAAFKVIQVHEQDGQVCIWAEVDSESPSVLKKFRCYGTGHFHLNNERTEYLGSAFVDGVVIHVYEVKGVF